VPGQDRFGSRQLRRLGRLVEFARELTGEHFRLGDEEAKGVPYEIRTLDQLDEREIRTAGILADIARYEYQEPLFGRKRDLYRVNLQDHNILRSLRRREDGIRFSPLLLYVLTHELVHVVRFVKFLAPFHTVTANMLQEEKRVHDTTCRILAHVPLEGMDRVLHRYDPPRDTI